MFVENWVRNSAHGMLGNKGTRQDNGPMKHLDVASKLPLMELRKICQCFREDDSHTSPPKMFSNMQKKREKKMNQAEYPRGQFF